MDLQRTVFFTMLAGLQPLVVIRAVVDQVARVLKHCDLGQRRNQFRQRVGMCGDKLCLLWVEKRVEL